MVNQKTGIGSTDMLHLVFLLNAFAAATATTAVTTAAAVQPTIVGGSVDGKMGMAVPRSGDNELAEWAEWEEQTDEDHHNGAQSEMLTFSVEPSGKRQSACFWEDLTAALPRVLRLWYFVHDEGEWEGDVTMEVANSGGDVVERQAARMKGTYHLRVDGKTSETGLEYDVYRICFKHHGSMLERSETRHITLSSKLVDLGAHLGKGGKELPLHLALDRVAETIDSLVSESRYMEIRLEDHLVLQHKTDATVAYYTVLESAIIIIVTVAQVCCIRSLFSSRKRALPL